MVFHTHMSLHLVCVAYVNKTEKYFCQSKFIYKGQRTRKAFKKYLLSEYNAVFKYPEL